MLEGTRFKNPKLLGIIVACSITLVLSHVAYGQDIASLKAETAAAAQTRDPLGLRPNHLKTEELVDLSEQAIKKGIQFLVKTQNDDGSWGSHDPKVASLLNFGFKTSNRGSQDAVRIACTAICAEALLSQKSLTDREESSLDSAIRELIKTHQFAYHPGESFNTWGYGYQLAFLVKLSESNLAGKYEKEIKAAAQACVNGLLKYQQHGGGWGYYAGVLNDFESMSFNTAFFGLSLFRAKKLGIHVPEGMIADASKAVGRQQVPDGSFLYSSKHETTTQSILNNLGSGSRTVSSTLALHEMGLADSDDLIRALEIFAVGENYLEQGRKLIRPHSAVHSISGYYFFFGYNYATAVAEKLGDRIDQQRWNRFAWAMIRTQEKSGSWWDTLAADYGDKWGTGFAIQSLQRYVKTTKLRSNSPDEAAKPSSKPKAGQ